MTYWDRVREYWAASEALVDGDTAFQAPVKMRPMLPISLMRPTVPIAVTGYRGAGKTVLYDSLVGKGGPDYTLKGRSDDAERHRTLIKTKSGKIRIGTIVVPGQESDERGAALGSIFGGSNYPIGVVHVVCWGYNQVWEAGDRLTVRQEISAANAPVDLAAVREWNLREELRDFDETCKLLKDAWRRKSRVWLIIAVAKCDLFWQDRVLARDYYIPGRPASSRPDDPPRESVFCRKLRDLVQYIGESNCDRLAIVPVSCYPDEYKFESGIAQAASVNIKQTYILVNRFRTLVGEFCG